MVFWFIFAWKWLFVFKLGVVGLQVTLKLKELQNERLEGSWGALWLGIRTFFGFKLESRSEFLPQSRQHDDFDRTQTGLDSGNTHFPDIF